MSRIVTPFDFVRALHKNRKSGLRGITLSIGRTKLKRGINRNAVISGTTQAFPVIGKVLLIANNSTALREHKVASRRVEKQVVARRQNAGHDVEQMWPEDITYRGERQIL